MIVFYIGKHFAIEKVRGIGRALLKQGFLTLLLFNAFNFSFSAGIDWTFSKHSSIQFVYASDFALYFSLTLTLIGVVCLAISSSKGYGEFKDKFKNHFVCRAYIGILLCYRIILGSTIATESTYSEGSFFVILVPLIFLLYFIGNLPFKEVLENYRSGLVNFSIIFCLLVSNYYRSMKSNTEMAIKARLGIAAKLEIALIVLCIIVSLAVLFKEIYPLVRSNICHSKRKITPV